MQEDFLRHQDYLRVALEREPNQKRETQGKTIAEIIKDKKKFQTVPSVSFHFVDQDEVRGFYNDTFKEPTIESLVTEITGEVTSEVKGGIAQVLQSKLGGKDLSKWISTIKLPDSSLSGMFARYQRRAIERGEVTLGLESRRPPGSKTRARRHRDSTGGRESLISFLSFKTRIDTEAIPPGSPPRNQSSHERPAAPPGRSWW